MDKFSRLPAPSNNGGDELSTDTKNAGPDCRRYYRAVWKYARSQLSRNPATSQIAEDETVGRLLQTFVLRHFWFSLLECLRRTNPMVRRYSWTVRGKTLVVWMPTAMAGKECRAWLEANVPDAHPDRPLERQRIQLIINEHLQQRRIVPLNDRVEHDVGAAAPVGGGLDPSLNGSVPDSLAAYVAQEKAARINRLRPAVRSLGPARLKQLILQIFSDLADGTYHDGQLARKYGLSRPSFSRFAGSRWKSNHCGCGRVVPDLWINTARVLAGVPSFLAAARDAGVLERVQEVLRRSDKGAVP